MFDNPKAIGLAVIGVGVLGFIIAAFLLIPSVRVTSSSPENGAEEVGVENFVFEAQFNRSINKNKTKFTIEPEITGHLKIEGSKLTFEATEQLNPLQEYVLKIEAHASFSRVLIQEITFKASKFGTTKTDIPPEEYFD